MVLRAGETWRPPLFTPRRGALSAAVAWLRRRLDLQAGSAWTDLAALLPECKGDFLDVGCGAQPFRPLLPKAVRYTGIDRVEARDHFGYEVPDTLYYAGDLWPVADGSMDVVLATETLEHVPDTAQFLGEAFRCLRPGGTLLLTVPFAARWHFIPHDYWRFTPAGLARVLGAAGFQNIAVYARGNEGTVACYKAMALILPLLFMPGRNVVLTLLRRLLGFALTPVLAVLALVGNLTLLGGGGDDCLGYTSVATRPG
jgi:SAM-dependent methyltransferase